MISRSFNWALRFVFALAYPVLCQVERTLGLSSNAVMIAVWYNNNLLVVRHSYKSGRSLPGGTIKPGESPKKAAVRELQEEVGIFARPAELRLVRSWRQRNGRTWVFEYCPAALPRIVPDQREVVAADFVSRQNLPPSLDKVAKRKN